VSGDNYEPNTVSQFMLVAANNVSQTTSNTIANNCLAHAA
jgi:hypothetical protein